MKITSPRLSDNLPHNDLCLAKCLVLKVDPAEEQRQALKCAPRDMRLVVELSLLLAVQAATFSQDLLAKPYYDLQFSNTTFTQSEASIQRSAASSSEDREFRTISNGKERYLCSIPKVSKPQDARSPEDRLRITQAEKEESLRASQRGWELLKGLEGTCLYWISGWWTYRFCYSDGITQFHARTPKPGAALYPPQEDDSAGVYSLGLRPKNLQTKIEKSSTALKEVSLKSSGDSKSLVVNYEKGTYCPIIGKERKTEIQFQCFPAANDHIALVNEVSSCQYLMIIRTARLCHDVAFQEAAKEPSNTITCTPLSDRSLPAIDAGSSEPGQAVAEDEQLKNLASAQTDAAEELNELQQDLKIDLAADSELRHLAFDELPQDLAEKLESIKKEKPIRGGQRPPDKTQAPPGDRNMPAQSKLNTALEMANDIAVQLADGTLAVEGESIFDSKNAGVEYEVELQDETGESLGHVVMKVVNGQVSVEVAKDLVEAQQKEQQSLAAKENKLAAQHIPEHVRAQFARFVQGAHEEL